MVQGEGAGIFVFEEYEHARKRGADILAEVAGFAMTSDASDIVMPSKQGAARAITGAMQDAKINPDEVGYINAHGTGTAANDKTECAAVADVFGAHADRLMMSSTKSMHGHLIGGTGAVELLACIMALRDGIDRAHHRLSKNLTRNARWTWCPTRRARQRSTWRCPMPLPLAG